jgi:hypothetical protein
VQPCLASSNDGHVNSRYAKPREAAGPMPVVAVRRLCFGDGDTLKKSSIPHELELNLSTLAELYLLPWLKASCHIGT